MQVMKSVEACASDFVSSLQMMQIGQGEMLTSVAAATGVQGVGVIPVFGIPDLDVAETGE